MAYRNGTYVAFNGCETTNPTESDMKYYALLKKWNSSGSYELSFSDSHEKTYSVSDDSKISTLKARLQERFRNSKQMLVIISENSSWNRGLLNWEIDQAATVYKIPIICAYTGYDAIVDVDSTLKSRWPSQLKFHIEQTKIYSAHVAFKERVIAEALSTFNLNSLPKYNITVFTREFYQQLGLL